MAQTENTTKRMKEVLDETVEYYRTHRRGKWGHSCTFYNANGDMCAVGRCMSDPGAVVATSVNVIPSKALEEYLQPRYRGLPRLFWSFLQAFHDTDSNWQTSDSAEGCTNLLTSNGREQYGYLIRWTDKWSKPIDRE